MNWRDDITQCIHRKKDGVQCKLETEPNEYVCEHHAIGLDDYIEDPVAVVAMFRNYFPKNHHPACDRKGQNDCSCPDRSFGELAGLALKRAAQTSLSRTKAHRDMVREEMLWKTSLIRDYYNSIDESHLWLEMPNPNWRQFRFFVWDDRARRLVVKKVRDVITNKTTLLRHLRKHCPHHCYYTTAQWADPQHLGPDPLSKSGWKKFKKRHGRTYTSAFNNFIEQELYFDVDYEMETFGDAARETLKLADFYEGINFHSCEKDVRFVFSGGKGFHMIDFGFRITNALGGVEVYKSRMKHILEEDTWDSLTKKGLSKGASYARQKMSRDLKKRLIKRIRRAGILLDYEVTVDPRRIIRLPGTIHGKRGRVCKMIEKEDLLDFEPGPSLW